MSSVGKLTELKNQAAEELSAVTTAEALEAWRIKYLGTKGAVRAAMAQMKDVPRKDKPAYGKAANELKNVLTAGFDEQKGKLGAPTAAKKTNAAPVDVTLPGRRPRIGRQHIITQTINEITEIFARMGFSVAYGPEVEDEHHNFDALNIPLSHPARDPLDNFYIDDDYMLRSQTSTVQIRVMEQHDPPIRVISPGRVYRPDTVDATHFFMFHQMEGLYVDEGVSMADLKTCLDQFCKAYYGLGVRTRFRPSFFPFTEPSAEFDVSCSFCEGKGCRICKQTGWIELGGCGMVDPNVLEAVNYDPEKYTGFAFGFGIERVLTQRHGISDIRLLFENDSRFVQQF